MIKSKKIDSKPISKETDKKIEASNSFVNGLTSFTYNKSDEDVENFINTFILLKHD
jgi:hypothetical protein